MPNDAQDRNAQAELDALLGGLSQRLNWLCCEHLNGLNSVYTIGFHRIAPPKPADLERQYDDLTDGLRQFLSDMFAGPSAGFVVLDQSAADVIHGMGAIPPTNEDLMALFLAPMLETLRPLQPSLYALTLRGERKYDWLLKPIVMSISVMAVRIDDTWYILMAIWSD